jgi:hypothetical protein
MSRNRPRPKTKISSNHIQLEEKILSRSYSSFPHQNQNNDEDDEDSRLKNRDMCGGGENRKTWKKDEKMCFFMAIIRHHYC